MGMIGKLEDPGWCPPNGRQHTRTSQKIGERRRKAWETASKRRTI